MTTIASGAPVEIGSAAPARRARAHPATRTARAFMLAIVAAWMAGFVVGLPVAIIVLTAFGFGAAVAGLRYPRIGFLAAGLLCTIEPLMNHLVFTGGLFRWNTFNYWLLLVAILWTPLLLRRGDLPLRLIQAVALLLAVGLIFSPDRQRGAQDLIALTSVFGLLVYLARGGTTRPDWYWLGVVCGTAALATGLQYFMQRDSLSEINPNAWVFSPLMALFTLCFALPCSYERRHGPLTVAVLAGAAFVGAFLSGSRGGMLAAAVCMLYFTAGMRGLRRRTTLLVSTGIVALAAVTQFSDMQHYAVARLELLFDRRTAVQDRTSNRSTLIESGWHLFRNRPMGAGTGGFTATLRTADARTGVTAGADLRDKAAHSGWIKVAVENGALGLALLGTFVASFAVIAFRRPARSMRSIGLLATTVLAFGFVTTEYQSKGTWFLAAAAIVLLGRSSPLWPARTPSA
jgi:hypothetical protein